MTSRTKLFLAILFLALVAIVGLSRTSLTSNADPTPVRDPETGELVYLTGFNDEGEVEIKLDMGSFTVHPSIHYKNLQVFPITAKVDLNHKTYVTLENALKDELAILKETSRVNELEMRNKSKNYIFIQSGDMVRGGKQDRTLAMDVIISPGKKKVKIESFCVEQGRWSKRGDEGADHFSMSENKLSNRSLGLAAKKEKNQSRVWKEVSKTQQKLDSSIALNYSYDISVQNVVSGSSLELSLSNDTLKSLIEEYKKAIESELDLDNLIGLAFAINGEVVGFDIYNNEKLYKDLENKILTAAVSESIEVLDSTATAKAVKLAEVSDLLEFSTSSATSKSTDKINENTQIQTVEIGLKNYFITTDLKEDKWIHYNLIMGEVEQASNFRHRQDGAEFEEAAESADDAVEEAQEEIEVVKDQLDEG